MALVKYNNNSLSAVTAASSLPTGAMTLIKSQTASSSATISFVHGTSDVVLDSTYPIYVFKWINAHPATDNQPLTVGFRDGSTNYDATKTTTFFYAYQGESSGTSALAYVAGSDLAQATGFQQLTGSVGNGNDESCAGEWYSAGYCNVTAAIDGVQFLQSSGNMDSGTIKLYGIKDS